MEDGVVEEKEGITQSAVSCAEEPEYEMEEAEAENDRVEEAVERAEKDDSKESKLATSAAWRTWFNWERCFQNAASMANCSKPNKRPNRKRTKRENWKKWTEADSQIENDSHKQIIGHEGAHQQQNLGQNKQLREIRKPNLVSFADDMSNLDACVMKNVSNRDMVLVLK